jgi:glycine dehydrogenase
MNLFDQQSSEFKQRHIGPNEADTAAMLATIGVPNMETLIGNTVPAAIRMQHALNLPPAISENEYLQLIREMGSRNKLFKNYIGQGYYDTITPSVILRNIFENPGWYTQYTPYQAEISQGRLESLLNFQTMVSDLTALPIANASLLDEATAAAEAVAMIFHHVNKGATIDKPKLFIDEAIFPQTIDVIITRSAPIGVELVFGNYTNATIDDSYFGAIIQYPNNLGSIEDYSRFIETVHAVNGYVIMATDLLALTLLTPPGELGADVAIGSAQRFGVPLGFGGPHAAFFSAKDEFKRSLPGRIIGVSIDAQGNRALRMALQTREQHIKREKATSNICTAQALLANMAAMYAVYHGPDGLKNIALRIAMLAQAAADAIVHRGCSLVSNNFFDTFVVKVTDIAPIKAKAERQQINLRYIDASHIGISIDETTGIKDLYDLINCFENDTDPVAFDIQQDGTLLHIPAGLLRTSAYLTHPVFNMHRSESQMMRYIKQLENKDLSLNTSMISLGSCTMNAPICTC